MKCLLTILFFCTAVYVLAATTRVGRNKQFTSIKAAITAAAAGDTILVESNTYHEGNLVISKPLVLKGVGRPVLDGDGKYEIISIKAANVTVDGFRLQHTGVSSLVDYAAIKIYNTTHAVITDNIIYDAFFGIYSQQGSSCLIRNNVLSAIRSEEQQSGNGIHCWKSDSMQITGNTISGHRDGIYFEFVTHSVIWRNNSFANLRYGLHFMFSNDDAYICNSFRSDGSGVAVMFSHGVKMFHNYFNQNWGDAAYGILLKEISDSYISNNYFEKNTMGIYAEGASRITVERNLFKSNGWAMKIQASCMDLLVIHNNFIGNTFDVGTNGSLVLNKFNNNYWDKYEGYDIDRDRLGDIPYRPVSMYSVIVEKNPPAMMLFHSFITALMDKTEKLIPSLTPENLKDEHPLMHPLPL